MGLKGPIFRGCLEEFAHFGSQGTHFYGMSGGICTIWISRDPFSEDVLRNLHILDLKGPIFRGFLEEFAHFGSQVPDFYKMSRGICTFWVSGG